MSDTTTKAEIPAFWTEFIESIDRIRTQVEAMKMMAIEVQRVADQHPKVVFICIGSDGIMMTMHAEKSVDEILPLLRDLRRLGFRMDGHHDLPDEGRRT